MEKILKEGVDVLHCLVCNQDIFVKASSVSRHVKRNKHISRLNRNSEAKSATSSTKSKCKSNYFYELTEALIAADIPFEKLNNPILNRCLRKWTEIKTPHPTTLRKLYVPKVYKGIMTLIKNELSDKYLWISIDETKDIFKRNAVNVIVGTLEGNKQTKHYLLSTQFVSSANADNMIKSIEKSLEKFWPLEQISEKILLLVTDRANYMKNAGEKLKVRFPKLIHLTCLAHGLHDISETIRLNFPLVNKFVLNAKKCSQNHQTVLKHLNV